MKSFSAKKIVLAALLLVPAVTLAQATPSSNTIPDESIAGTFRYTYFEGGYVNDNLTGVENDGAGFALRAGMALARNWHLFGSYTKANLDPGGVDWEFDTAGVGFNFSFNPNWDLVAQ